MLLKLQHSDQSMKNISLATIQAFLLGVISLTYTLPTSAEQACVRNQEGKLVCGEFVNKKSPTESNSSDNKMQVRNQLGIDFGLEGCKKSKAGLHCSLSIYNSTDFDKQMGWNIFMGNNVLIDSEGHQYTTQAIKFGNINRDATLPPKTTMKAQVFFRPSNGLSSYIRVLQIAPIIESNNNIRLTFRDFRVN
jgi:hypothetical protein